MPLFSRIKSKAKKGDGKDSKKATAADERPRSEPYTHTPKHAGADALANGAAAAGQQKPVRDPRKRHTFTDAATSHAVAHGRPFAGPAPPHRSSYTTPNRSGEAFVTSRDAPPMPQSPGFGRFNAHSPSNSIGSTGRGTFPRVHQAPSFDSPILGNPKMQAAARDRGYVNPTADSGYGSRTPSVHASIPEGQPPILRSGSGFLPHMSLSEELAQEPAFSEHSFNEDMPTSNTSSSNRTSSASNPKTLEVAAPRKLQKQRSGNFSKPNPHADASSLKPTKSLKSSLKQTRFEDSVQEPLPITNRAAPMSDADAQMLHQQDRLQLPTHVLSPPLLPQQSAPTSSLQRHPSYTRYENVSLSPQIYPVQSPDYASNRNSQQRFAMPNLAILDGLKVNKRGRVLDEEGEPVGELVDGDLIDCVRQKINIYGEVVDEYGSVVGRVRTLVRGGERTASPAPQVQQQSDYFQNHFHPPSVQGGTMSPLSLPERPGSATPYKPDQTYHFQPQDYSWPTQQYAVPAPRQYELEIAQPKPRLPAVSPSNLSGGHAVLELDGSAENELMPVMDLSDIFIPMSSTIPMIPNRSPLRSRTPSSADSKNAPQSSASSRSSRSSNELQLAQALSPAASLPAPAPSPAPTPSPVPAIGSTPMPTPQKEEIPPPPPIPEEEVPQRSTAPTPPPQKAKRWINPQSLWRSKSDAKTSPRSSASSTPEPKTDSKVFPQPPATPPPEPQARKGKNLFAYKGDIPAADGPAPNTGLSPLRAAAKSPPPLPNFPRQAFTGGLPGGIPFTPLNATTLSGSGNLAPPSLGPRSRTSTGMGLNSQMQMTSRPGMKGRYSYHAPLVRSPLSSHETTPPESDEGQSDDGKFASLRPNPIAWQKNRPASIRSTTASIRTTATEKRTYFTHGGRVTVEPGQLPPSAKAAQDPRRASTPDLAPSPKDEKKKSRLSVFSKPKAK